MRYIQTGEFQLSIKKSETMLFSGEGIELEATRLSEISHSVIYSVLWVLSSQVNLEEDESKRGTTRSGG